MKKYSLTEFLELPLHQLLDNQEDYCFTALTHDSFYAGHSETISKIKIPVIQRDYAQGRADNRVLREEFIDKLFNHLESRTEVLLDFIYGSSELGQEHVFLPLDGQQRLTTLFLLHWYILSREDRESKYPGIILQKLSYETRDTSRRFFDQLSQFKFDGNPKESIEKAYWFHDTYLLDPTIVGVLYMLETIHCRYESSVRKGSLKDGLAGIQFFILSMGQYKLTDDLYIKLNARGKILSAFESLKADLLGHIEGMHDFQHQVYLLDNDSEDDFEVPYYAQIAHKFDNKWAGFFWKKTKIVSDEHKSIDGYFFRFIHQLLYNSAVLKHIENNKEHVNFLKELENKTNSKKNPHYQHLSFYSLQGSSLFDKDFIISLTYLLDFYSQHEADVSLAIQDIFSSLLQNDWDIHEVDTSLKRIIFAAVNQFIITSKEEFDFQKFKEWLRIVKNLVGDPELNEHTVIKLFSELATVAEGDIYLALINGKLDYLNADSRNSNVFEYHLVEEKEKVILICSYLGASWLPLILRAEAHPLFQGSIGFLLFDNPSIATFEERLYLAEQLFDKDGAVKLLATEDHALFRFVISQFKTIEEFKHTYYHDTGKHWTFFFRREKHLIIRASLHQLLILSSLNEIQDFIHAAITTPSTIEDVTTRIIHDRLYYYGDLHKWFQTNKINVIWDYGQLYLNKYNDRSDNRVIIDCYRNELIHQLVHQLDFKTTARCSDTSFYKGLIVKGTIHIDQDTQVHVLFNNMVVTLETKKTHHTESNELPTVTFEAKKELETRPLKDLAEVELTFNEIKDYVEQVRNIDFVVA